ncbi:ABC-2 type transport system ATP-binding protein [Evansella caseinilytica]|uniref:ABC-2 type transport system ATP-binding protein n=1 Tax=Evansella caseinilytica TaxID=1503961 RepID=A0A1H3HYP7_9BACI|nr:ABC transporter ATP-binding protein [Evansella caseinilytica]SDY20623.1 ABC-2 type transport system ATP-binding protein [Evansella caseinilytica]
MDNFMLNIRGLTKRFDKFTFGPVDLQVEKGTVLALVGANSSGKTTFFRLLMSILQPDDGTIELLHQRLADNETELKKQVGFAGELLAPFEHLSIKELASLISYWYPTWDHERYTYFIERYAIDDSAKLGKSSKGTWKKIEFIFALCHRPQLLLLDEPSAGVDISSQRKIREDVTAFMEDGEKNVVLATHNIEEIKHLCDYVAILHKGKLVRTILKDDIFDNWSRVWLPSVTKKIADHPNTVAIAEHPPQIVTDNLEETEKLLQEERMNVLNRQRLQLDEVIEYIGSPPPGR